MLKSPPKWLSIFCKFFWKSVRLAFFTLVLNIQSEGTNPHDPRKMLITTHHISALEEMFVPSLGDWYLSSKMGRDGFMYLSRYFEKVYYTDSTVPSDPLFSVLATVGLESFESHARQRLLVGWRFVGNKFTPMIYCLYLYGRPTYIYGIFSTAMETYGRFQEYDLVQLPLHLKLLNKWCKMNGNFC